MAMALGEKKIKSPRLAGLLAALEAHSPLE
jgi:hypothetical protein